MWFIGWPFRCLYNWGHTRFFLSPLACHMQSIYRTYLYERGRMHFTKSINNHALSFVVHFFWIITRKPFLNCTVLKYAWNKWSGVRLLKTSATESWGAGPHDSLPHMDKINTAHHGVCREHPCNGYWKKNDLNITMEKSKTLTGQNNIKGEEQNRWTDTDQPQELSKG